MSDKKRSLNAWMTEEQSGSIFACPFDTVTRISKESIGRTCQARRRANDIKLKRMINAATSNGGKADRSNFSPFSVPYPSCFNCKYDGKLPSRIIRRITQ